MNTVRVLAAGLLLALYGAWCVAVWRRTRRALPDAPAPDGALLVVHASQTGVAEQIARHTQQTLLDAGRAARLLPLGELDAATLRAARELLVVASTTGEGDAPDAAESFVSGVMAADLPLAGLRHAVLALGDRDYDGFCAFGRRLDAWLQAQGAAPLFERIEVDNGDAAALAAWQQRLGELADTASGAAWQAPAFGRWRLAARRHLNPGSAGAPLFAIEFEPVDAPLPHWQAGDLAQLQVGDPPQQRDYSIASLPSEGRLRLLVRLAQQPDGGDGRVSGWLTQRAALGSELALRLRAHAGFRIGDNGTRPLILVGNGSGFAGLRGHLKAREALPATRREPCWLVYGERQAAVDGHHHDEVDAWRRAGVLAHADLVFSRDQARRRHVQHALADHAPRLREWVDRGAAVYVCGRAKGMGEGVDDALRKALGDAALRRLAREGRYRRDVY